MLVVFKSAPILKRALKVKQAMMQLYVLKLLKIQTKYLGRQWRKSNMKTMSAIYQKVRHRLNDDWAYGNGEPGAASWLTGIPVCLCPVSLSLAVSFSPDALARQNYTAMFWSVSSCRKELWKSKCRIALAAKSTKTKGVIDCHFNGEKWA